MKISQPVTASLSVERGNIIVFLKMLVSQRVKLVVLSPVIKMEYVVQGRVVIVLTVMKRLITVD